MRIQSSASQTRILALAIGLVGFLLIAFSKDQAEFSRNHQAAFLLGFLLFIIGLFNIIMEEKVTIDVMKSKLVIKRHGLLGPLTKTLSIEELQSASVVKIGTSSDGTPSYHFQINLKNGEAIKTGRWSLDKDEIEQVVKEFAQQVGCQSVGLHAKSKINVKDFMLAAVGAIVAYMVWYRTQVGPFCLAMWFGTAPVYIIASAFAMVLTLKKRLR